MNKNTIMYYALLFLGVFISSISQVLLKKSSNKKYTDKIKEYLNPLVIIAYFIFFVSTLLSIVSYKKVPMSMGPIIEATSYIYITLFGVTIFKEKLNYKKILALILIISGICIYSFL